MKAFFGISFIVLGVILVLTQIFIFILEQNMAAWQMILLFFFTIGSLAFGGSLVYLEKAQQIADQTAAIISLILCIGLISLMSFLIIAKDPNLTAYEYAIMIIYTIIAGVYGFVGVI